MFRFDDDQLKQAMDKWSAAQHEKNPDLLDKHVDYMKGSILAFLYSPEAATLIEEDNENTTLGA